MDLEVAERINEKIERPNDVIKTKEVNTYLKELFNIKLAENYINKSKHL